MVDTSIRNESNAILAPFDTKKVWFGVYHEGMTPADGKVNCDAIIASAFRNRPVDPSDYGLIADGTAHQLSERYATLAEAQAVYPFVTSLTQQIDWAACKLASNIAFGADGSEHGTNSHLNRKIFLPPGVYWFGNDTWRIRNLASGVIEGSGQLATIIRGNATLLSIDGAWYSTFRDFSLQLQSTTGITALEVDGNVPGHPYPTRGVQACLFESLLIDGGGSTFAFTFNRLGGSGGQGDTCVFNKLTLSNASQACYYQNGYNSLSNIFLGGNIANFPKHGIYVLNGTIAVYGTSFQSTKGYAQLENDGWDISCGDGGVFDNIPIIGVRTESLRFLRNAGAVTTTVIGCSGRAALTGWFANTAFGPSAPLGKAIIENGRLFVVATAGTSGSVEPTWPTDGSPVSDGSVVWQEQSFNVIDMPDTPYAGSIDTNSCSFACGAIKGHKTTDEVGIWSQSSSVSATNQTIIVADATNNAMSVALPASPQRGQRVIVKKADASANAVTITGPGVGFEGAVFSIQIPGGSRGWREFLYYDGDANGARRWLIIGSG